MAKNENKKKMTAEEVLNKSKKIEDRINVTFRLKESLVKDLKRVCKANGNTASSVIEVLLAEFLDGLK